MHKCLRCGTKFERITSEMLQGCPNCGGKLFLYVREGAYQNAAELVDRIQVEEQREPFEVDRIESLRILSPGVYELNLDALMERKELILKLQKDGTYIVPLSALFRKKRKKR
jgi:predicted  nucleic acid-binding Zn-ribbon protein